MVPKYDEKPVPYNTTLAACDGVAPGKDMMSCSCLDCEAACEAKVFPEIEKWGDGESEQNYIPTLKRVTLSVFLVGLAAKGPQNPR